MLMDYTTEPQPRRRQPEGVQVAGLMDFFELAARGRPSVVDIPDAGRFDARPISEIENVAREYMDARGMDSSPQHKPAVEGRGARGR